MPQNPNEDNYEQCGSNLDASLDFVAPSRKILSTLPVGAVYSEVDPLHDLCNDSNFPADGIGYCTGTSMASPLATGVVALIRSVNPLITRGDLRKVLDETADIQAGTYLKMPDAAAAVQATYGTVGGQTAKLRLTPMFLLKNTADKDRLYTTRPQVAQGALTGLYLSDPPNTDCWILIPPICGAPTAAEIARPYGSASDEANPVNGYLYYPAFGSEIGVQPAAAFWVLTSDKTGISDADVRPLYRLSFAEICDWRDHVYTTSQAGIDHLSTTDWCPTKQSGRQAFNYDGIEGYIFGSCPTGFSCNNPNDPSEPQALYRRFSYTHEMSALLLESQLTLPQYSTYGSDPYCHPGCGTTTGFLGYVFLNVDTDSDGLPDGFERLLGLNRLSPNTDGDGCADGHEYPIAYPWPTNRDPLVADGGICQ